MLIGSDFPKIEFEMFGMQLLEPNGFIGDTLIFLLAMFYYYKLRKNSPSLTDEYINNWKRFFIWFGLSFFLGGFGHLFYNYFGIYGKIPSWYLAMWAPYYIEQAVFSIYPKISSRKPLLKFSLIKLIVFLIIQTYILLTIDLSTKPELGILLPSISSAIGLIFGLGILGAFYQKVVHPSFKYMWMSVLTLFLSTLPQMMKINPHPHFDRNDVSHLLILVTMALYYAGIKRHKELEN